MIASLDGAWGWYRAVYELTRSMRRLGEKHWETLPWGGDLGRDGHLRDLQAPKIVEMSDAVLADLDDLAVLLFFSVFEARVRESVRDAVAAELPEVRHPALDAAMKGLSEAIENGSLFRVLEPYKGLDVGLIEEVNQVRRYRNWVAHWRRGKQPDAVVPKVAYDRLRRFLDLVVVTPPSASVGGEGAPD